MSFSRRGSVVGSLTLAVVLSMASPVVADVTPGPGEPETLTASPMATYQTNGTVWTMEIVNNVLYVGGNFTAVRPSGAAPGTNETPRNRLAAFNATTGALLPWAPSATSKPFTPTGSPDANCWPAGGGQYECATVWSIKATPDKRKLVVGGDFQTLDGKVRAGLAAFDAASGALDSTFKPSVSGRIYSVFPTEDGVYVGGGVSKAGGQARSHLAAFDFPSGILRPWAPAIVKGRSVASGFGGVRSLVVTDDRTRVIVGGGFDQINGTAVHGLAAVDATSGANAPWQDKLIPEKTAITSLTLKGGKLYTTGDALGSVAEGVIAFDPATGNELWTDGCQGASHSMQEIRGVIYAGSHSHDCGAAVDGFSEQYVGYSSTDRRRYKLRAEVPAEDGRARILTWFPDTNDGNGPRAMATDGDRLWVGGEFTYVDGKPQQGLTAFGFLSTGGVNHKPITPAQPVVYSDQAGKVEIVWKATEDPDNRNLEYWLIRDHVTKYPIAKISRSDKPWLKGWMSFTDTNVAPGESHTYDVRAVDPTGTATAFGSRSPGVTVTVAGSDATAADLPKLERATAHYPFDAKVGSNFIDLVSSRTAVAGSGTTVTPGLKTGSGAVTLSGASRGAVVESTRQYSPRQLSFEAVFRTATDRGGVLMSLGSDNSTSSSVKANNILYMSNNGRLNFGVRPDAIPTLPWSDPAPSTRVLSTSNSYNDDAWHHVVVTFEPGAGSRIYVDGALVAGDESMNWSRSMNAYLRIGADTTSDWLGAPSSDWFAGTIDGATYYEYPLTNSQVARHAEVLLSAG